MCQKRDMAERGLDPVLPLGGTRRIVPKAGHGRARFAPFTTPRGGRAELCQKGDMAERGLDPVLPLRGDARNSAKSGTWPSEVWTPYYPYG